MYAFFFSTMRANCFSHVILMTWSFYLHFLKTTSCEILIMKFSQACKGESTYAIFIHVESE
jgi:hypothetical protein